MDLKWTCILKTGQCNSFVVNPEQKNAMDAECSLISEPNSKWWQVVFACFYVSEYIQKIVVKDIINVYRFKQNEGIE